MPSNIPGGGIAGHRLAGQMPDGKHVPKTVSDSATYPSQTIDTETKEQLMRMPLRSGSRATTESTPAVSRWEQEWADAEATDRAEAARGSAAADARVALPSRSVGGRRSPPCGDLPADAGLLARRRGRRDRGSNGDGGRDPYVGPAGRSLPGTTARGGGRRRARVRCGTELRRRGGDPSRRREDSLRRVHPLRALFRRQRARTAGLADLAPVSALATPASTGSSGECADRRPLGSRPNLGPAARPDSVAARSGGFRRRGDLGVRGTARRRLYRTAGPRTRRHAPARTDARADGRRPRADDAQPALGHRGRRLGPDTDGMTKGGTRCERPSSHWRWRSRLAPSRGHPHSETFRPRSTSPHKRVTRGR